MTDRELMQQALEALEQYTDVVASGNEPDAWITVVDAGKPAREAITALRERLAQPGSVQVSALDFNHMTLDKEHLTGRPLIWAQWPEEKQDAK